MVIIIASLPGSGFLRRSWGSFGVVYGWLWLFFCLAFLANPAFFCSHGVSGRGGRGEREFWRRRGLGLQTWLIL